jgi:hypothetical protein
MLSRLERALERAVEGSVAAAFRLQVQPAEIGRRLERALLDGRVTSVGTTLAPNHFEVHLHPEDATAFADWQDALCRELETWLAEVAYARGLGTVGAFRVNIVEDERVRRRSVRATARFAGEPSADRHRASSHSGVPHLRLKPVDGGFPEAVLLTRSVTVGRAAENDLVLPEAGVSRRHARLEPDADSWRVVDLDSTNGTWRNGERVRRSLIGEGDELAFGPVRYTVRAR